MEDKVLPDASILIALYYEYDSQHHEAITFFDMHGAPSFLFLESTLRELLTVLTYKGGHEFACACMDDILDTLDYDIVRDDFSRELLFFRSLGRKISFVDSAILYHSSILDVRFASFDKELNKLGKKQNNY